MNNNIDKNMYWDDLPKKILKNGKVVNDIPNWVGKECRFCYGNIHGKVEIINYNKSNSKLTINI